MRLKNTLFVRYLLSYIIAMLIPMLVLGYISYTYFLSVYTQNLERNKINTLSTFRLTMDMQFSQLQQNASMVSGMSEYSTGYQLKSYAQFLDITRSLSGIRSPNKFLYDMHFLNTELGYIYTPQTRFDLGAYSQYGVSYDGYTEAELTGILKNLNGVVWLPMQSVGKGAEQALSYILPTSRDKYGAVESAAIFLISKQTIDGISGSAAQGTGTKILMVDSNRSPIYNSFGSPAESVPSFPDGFWDEFENASSPDDPFRFELNGGKAIAYAFPSKVTNLQYICVIDYAELTQPLEQFKLLFFAGLTVIAVTGGFAIFYFMRKNYRPIRSLGRLSETLLESGQVPVDDLQAAELAITTIQRNNRLISTLNQRFKQESLLLRLLRGAYQDMDMFSEDAQALDIYLNGPLYRVVICGCGREQNGGGLIENVSRFFKSALSADMEVYVVEYAEDNSVIALLSGESAAVQSAGSRLSGIAESLSEMFGGLKIGISESYSRLERSRVHCQQALAAVKYQQPAEGRTVVCFNESAMNAIDGSYPSDGLAALFNAIQMGDTGHIEFAVDMLLPYFRNIGSPFIIMCLGYDIVNTALRAMREIDYPAFQFNKKYPELLLKTRFDSTDEIINIVKMLSIEICEYINLTGAPQTNEAAGGQAAPGSVIAGGQEDDIAEVLEFIREHYTESNFSAKALAGNFGMSISNFSHFFKNHTGKVVSGYIAALRLEKAKDLLRCTGMTVAEVADASGYCHVSTLMRQFKASENITPSLYRSQYKSLLPSREVRAASG